MKTIKIVKVIDLINLIANEEEIPMRIKIRGNIFEWKVTENGAGYCNEEKYKGYDWLEEYISFDNRDDLNTAVEIIEEAELIKPLPEQIILESYENNNEMALAKAIHKCKQKINELIDVINEIKEGKE